MQTEDIINPYEPPKATSLVEEGVGKISALRRPASVKWIIFVLVFYTVIFSVKIWDAIFDRGFWSVMNKASVWGIMILPPIALFVAFFGRTKLAHRIVSGILCLATCVQAKFAWNNWMMTSGDWRYLVNHSVEIMISTCLVYLFCCFIFGRSARDYFGSVSGD